MAATALPTFGAWMKTQRLACDLTQKELASQVQCAEITIRKIEADQLRPSKRLARALLQKLHIPQSDKPALLELARRRTLNPFLKKIVQTD